MKRLSIIAMAALFVSGLGLSSLAAPTNAQNSENSGSQVTQQTVPAADFGSPPTGAIPILYNDHHVYTRPDKLKQGRVLAALVRDGTILVPLRSMFEQMCATVSWNQASQTADVTKPGADIKVTVGKHEVVINGESRPLDVPPEMYQGTVVVPVRVISETMGAYVLWVAEQRLVVVRYNGCATPTPPPPPPPPPTLTPAPATAPYKDHFIVGDYIFSPKAYNEFSPGNTGTGSYDVRGGFEFDALGLPWMLEGDFRQIEWPHNQNSPTPAIFSPCLFPGSQGCVTVIGGGGQVFVPSFRARNQDFDVRLGLKVIDPRIYIGVGYLWRTNNYGYPSLNNIGFGLEKLPDLNQGFSVYGSAWYYPNVHGNYTDPLGNNFRLAYNELKYQIGGTIGFGPVFLDLGWLGENLSNKTNAPIGVNEQGPFVGLGIRF